MNITLPILLLVFGGLTFWILNESKLKWYIRTALIASFCSFTILFYTLIHTFLGWGADQEDMPDKVAIHWVIIKEPNKAREFDGAIYITLETAEKTKDNKLVSFFGYGSNKIQPRLFKIKYSRELHEKLEGLKSKLKSGQPVMGKLTKSLVGQ